MHCEVGEWSEWSPCSRSGRTCGFKRGQETRTRQVLQYPSPFGNPCPEISEIKECLVKRRKCPGKGNNMNIADCFCIIVVCGYCSCCAPITLTANIFVTHGTISMNSRPCCFSLYNQSSSVFRSGLRLFTQRIVIVVRVRTVGGTHMCDVAMGMLCVFPRDLFGFLNSKTAFSPPSKQGIA